MTRRYLGFEVSVFVILFSLVIQVITMLAVAHIAWGWL